MKVRGIVFSGFMSAILMSVVGMDASAVNLASKSYVDNALAQKQNTLTAGEGIDITDNVVKSTIDTSKFAMKDEIPGLGAFATDEELDQLKTTLEAAIAEKQEKGDYASAADLKSLQDAVSGLQSGGVDKTLVENLKTTVETISADYAKKTELTAVEGKLQAAIEAIVVPSLEGYAKLTDIPSLDGYAKTADVAATYATKESLTDYAKASDLANKAEASEVNALQQSVTNIENTYLTQEAAQNTYVTENKVTEQITQVVGTDTSGLKKQVADNTAALAGKADKSELTGLVTSDQLSALRSELEAEIEKKQATGDYVEADALKAVSDSLAELKNDSYTKKEIDDKIAAAISGGEIDLSGYATTSALEALQALVSGNTSEITALKNAGYQTADDVSGAITTATADLATKSELNTALTGYTKTADLAAVATSGSYNDLKDQPTIPSIEGLATSKQLEDLQSTLEAEIAKKQNSGQYLVAADLTTLNNAVSALQSGKADASTVTTLQETVSKLGETYVTDSELSSAIDGVEALIAAIKVPTKTSELTNDSGYIIETELDGYAKSADVADVYATKASLSDYATTTALAGKADASALSDYALKSEIPSVAGFVTTEQLANIQNTLQTAIDDKQAKGDYAAAADLTKLQEDVAALQSGSSGSVDTSALETRIKAIEDTYATDTELNDAIDAVKLLIPSSDGFLATPENPGIGAYVLYAQCTNSKCRYSLMSVDELLASGDSGVGGL